MVVGAIALFMVIRSYGETLVAPAAAGLAASTAKVEMSRPNPVLHVLLVLAAVVLTGRLLGPLVRLVGQPPVIAEVIAGVLLGPSVLGLIAPGLSSRLLPSSVAPSLNIVAQLGVVLYMFLVGLDLNADPMRRRARTTLATSHASIVTPFILGSVLALYLYPRLSTNDVSFTSFALFMGVAMSITAFPVLARILTDRGMSHTDLGVVALACAAIDDVTAWCLLAFVVGVAQGRGLGAGIVAIMTVGFVCVTWFAIRPAIVRLLARSRERAGSPEAMTMALAGLLLSAATTEFIGIHAVFGAFLFGVIIPRDSLLARRLTERLSDLVTIVLLPAFFAFTGMRTRIDLIPGVSGWLICGLITLVATTGKFGGTAVAARLTGLPWRDAASLGILMNTRGLMELIALNIGLDLGVISPTLFTMLVMMALVTTIATTPILQVFHPGSAGLGYNRTAFR
jgi:Kef-type K+ transport system membrane component KefB